MRFYIDEQGKKFVEMIGTGERVPVELVNLETGELLQNEPQPEPVDTEE